MHLVSNEGLRSVLQQVRQWAGSPPGEGDAQLLRRFVQRHDEPAFIELLRRHGPMVLGVCRRYLNDWQAAEDAFQATFLVLACKAASLPARPTVGPWLYEVACRTARKARAQALARPRREAQTQPPLPPADPAEEAARR